MAVPIVLHGSILDTFDNEIHVTYFYAPPVKNGFLYETGPVSKRPPVKPREESTSDCGKQRSHMAVFTGHEGHGTMTELRCIFLLACSSQLINSKSSLDVTFIVVVSPGRIRVMVCIRWRILA